MWLSEGNRSLEEGDSNSVATVNVTAGAEGLGWASGSDCCNVTDGLAGRACATSARAVADAEDNGDFTLKRRSKCSTTEMMEDLGGRYGLGGGMRKRSTSKSGSFPTELASDPPLNVLFV